MPLSRAQYPNLAAEGYEEKSAPTPSYNCIAWAAESNAGWWWPHSLATWPPGSPREVTIAAFVAMFESLGYEMCDAPGLEEGFKKIAIYALRGEPKHAARQLSSGCWTSKIGKNIDIEHTLRGLEGPFYGVVVAVMKKPL